MNGKPNVYSIIWMLCITQCVITTVRTGQSATLVFNVTCTYPNPVLYWIKGLSSTDGDIVIWAGSGDQHPQIGYDRHTIIGNGSLQIEHTSVTDTGTYWCRLTAFGLNPALEDSLSMFVGVGAYINPVPSDRFVVEGENVLLNCSVFGNPDQFNFTWFKDDIMISTDDSHYMIEDGFLNINGVVRMDSAVYKCEVYNIVGGDAAEASLEVQYGPEITVTEYVEILEGCDLHVECYVDANPEATVLWMKDDVTVHGSELHIQTINRNQDGIYTCYTTNTLFTGEVYTANASSKINVLYGAEFVEDGSPSEITAVILPVTTTTIITCIRDGNPEVTYTWFHNSDVINVDNDPRYSITSPGGTLEIEDINRYEFDDEYTCLITNNVSAERASSRLYLHYNPNIVNDEYERRDIDEGQNITLDCIVDAVPHADVYWFNGTTETTRCERCKITTMEVNETHVHSELHILNVGIYDSGEYNCTATNIYGVDSHIVSLDTVPNSSSPTTGIVVFICLLVVTAVVIISVICWRKRNAHCLGKG
ncbi:contactin-1-like [Saccoglossus kowalevskii]